VYCIFHIIFFLEKPWVCYVIILIIFDYFGRTGKSSSEKALPYRTSDPESDRRTGMSRKPSSGGLASDQSSDTHAADVTYASQ
jgi:hypothetical protein